MSLAIITTISAMSISAMAETHGTVDSLDDLRNAPIRFEMDSNGFWTPIYANNGILPLNDSTPPTGNYKSYIFGDGNSTSPNIIMNGSPVFDFSFDSSCTTSTKKYADFVIGASDRGILIHFKGTGNVSTNLTMRLVPLIGDGTITRTITLNASSSISIYNLVGGRAYAVELSPTVAGQAVEGDLQIKKWAF